jgi:hypothetical protein
MVPPLYANDEGDPLAPNDVLPPGAAPPPPTTIAYVASCKVTVDSRDPPPPVCSPLTEDLYPPPPPPPPIPPPPDPPPATTKNSTPDFPEGGDSTTRDPLEVKVCTVYEPTVVFVPPDASNPFSALDAPPPTSKFCLKYSKRCPSAFVVVG